MDMFPFGAFRGPYLGKVIEATPWDEATPALRRWYYEVELVEYDPTGPTSPVNSFGTPIEVPDTGVAILMNVFEMANTATQSMGIAHANLPGTYQLQPIPTDTIVPVWAHPNGFITLWPNQFDGNCEAAP